jgi:GTP-binding protein EngB required for normal cell division
MGSSHNPEQLLNEFQRNRLSVTCSYIDKLLKDIEEVLNATASKSPFPKYVSDISPAQRRVIEDYIARFRSQLLRVLEGMRIPVPAARISAVHSLRTSLTFIDIAVEELKPRYMRGYGEVPEKAQESLNGIVAELDGLVRQLNAYLASEAGGAFDKRLKVLEALGAIDVQGLQTIEKIIGKYGLVEFRPALATILDRLEDPTFEIAVFGRVSSGKSSLLNRILETDILPVGVTPITAVPTRIRVGSSAQLAVSIAGFGTQLYEVSRISEFATEQGNPANAKRVAKLALTLPSTKLRKGITFVDTPGLGSLASAGAAETMAYLPRCDFALVLIDAGNSLSEDDLRLLRTLYSVGIPSAVLLSKSDLVDESQRVQLASYIESHVERELGLKITVVPVSADPACQDMLDNWYQNQLTPLFDMASQLRLQSVARKIGSTRAALESTLRSLQKRSEQPDSKQTVQEEDNLRRFSGRFVQLKKDAHAIVDRIDSSRDLIVREAVGRAWQFRKGSDFSARIQHELDSLTNDLGTVVFNRIQQFLPEMVVQLSRTADAVASPSRPTEQDFAGIAREMPRFEAPAIPSKEIGQPGASRILGTSFAQNLLVKQLKNSVGHTLSDNLSYYRTMMRNWVESVTTHLHSSFDSFAELYRGSLRRELSVDDHTVSQEEVEADLKSLQELAVSAV